MAHDVFVSHSAKDKEVADRVCEALEAEGIKCWIAPRDILPAQIWAEAIVDAIDSSKVMIAVLSSNANQSGQIKREIERADASNAMLVPFLVERFTPSNYLEYYIGNTHWFDASQPPLESHLAKLAQTVRQLIAKRQEAERAGDVKEKEGPAAFVTTRPTPPPPPPVDTTRKEYAPEDARGHATRGGEASAASGSQFTDAGAPPPKPKPWTWIIVGVAALLAVSVAIIALTRRGDPPQARTNSVTPTATPTPGASPGPGPRGRDELAAAKEREGFQNLIDGRYEQAIASFEEANRIFPQFHSAFEIANVLKRSRPSFGDPEKMKPVLRNIANSFQGPGDLRQQLKDLAGAAPPVQRPTPLRPVINANISRPIIINRRPDN